MSFLKVLHPELNIDNFSRLDGTITYFAFVKGAMKRVKAKKILDYGAGRGAEFIIYDDQNGSLFRRDLLDLRSDGAEVWAADIDPAVMAHPASHHQLVFKPGESLPLDDESFDLINSEFVFEHIAQPEQVAAELMRLLKPGGYLCARTANKYGYVTLAARMIPNKRHVGWLRRVMPDRHEEDVFPTIYKMNSVRDIKRLFPGCEVYWYRDSAGPSYYFGSPIMYRIMLGVHKILPNWAATGLCLFIRKPLAAG
jgi:SAM-dependent methyltransferase